MTNNRLLVSARQAIRAKLNEYLVNGLADSAIQINSGQCIDFADELCGQSGLESISIEAFQTVDQSLDDADDRKFEEGRPLDRCLLSDEWPGVVPPEGMDWDSLDEWAADISLSGGHHVFLMHSEKLFFDAECPEGTPNFLELPFFQRLIQSWKEERDLQADDALRL
ncbi:hypothetical protein ACFOY8_14245 [Thalassospira xianhensis]|uniref:Uncharacterized protein n=1 Tax=Thalassospira xianhensis MCCC 1A02616 TaxID=1177929 RepID=A0A367UHA6_9PROT|nr:hypothetical protein [Thalassospira xianhensis]RCK07686.1 hypothetical protein TH5_01020 [Thalassospira xianhensis MCCC 1A02616]